MKVAESIDREHIDEHWNEEYVCEEADCITGYILQKVNGSHKYWHCIDAEHYHTSKHKIREVILSSLIPFLSVSIVLFLGRVK